MFGTTSTAHCVQYAALQICIIAEMEHICTYMFYTRIRVFDDCADGAAAHRLRGGFKVIHWS